MLRPTGRRARTSQFSWVRGGVKKRLGSLGGDIFLWKPVDEGKAKSYRHGNVTWCDKVYVMGRIRKCRRMGCDNPVPQSEGRGRPQKYCRHACKIAAFRRRHRHRGVRQATAGPAEWYTPSWVVELARDTLGGIDLDPSSDLTAQAVVKAGTWHGCGRPDADGGLSPGAVWAGRCWMNPPYGKGLLQAFIERLIAEVDAGHVTQALVLTSVHAMSSASSGQKLMAASAATCVLRGRLTFWGEHSTGATPTFGSVVTGLGDVDPARFAQVWGPRGVVTVGRVIGKAGSEHVG